MSRYEANSARKDMVNHLYQKQAQIAVEFLVLVHAAFLLLLIFTIAVRDQSASLSDEEEFRNVQDMAYSIAGEIGSATYVGDGYVRTFVIENMSGTYPVNARVESNYVVVNSTNHEYMVAIPHVEGQLQSGNNKIRRTGGVLYLNS